jgi:hypothetical protein
LGLFVKKTIKNKKNNSPKLNKFIPHKKIKKMSSETQRTLSEIQRRITPLAPRIHRNLNFDIFEDDLIEVEITMAYFGYESNPDTLTARVLNIEWDGPDDATITALIIQNHYELYGLESDVTLEDMVIEVFANFGAPFDAELMIPEHIAESVLTMRNKKKQKQRKRRSEAQYIFEEACLDNEIAARVCHTDDGITTRNKFYPFKKN